MCRSRKAISRVTEEASRESENLNYNNSNHSSISHIINAVKKCESPIMVEVFADGRNHKMELDTGSPISAISLKLYRSHFSKYELFLATANYKGYTGELIVPKGFIRVKITYQGRADMINFYVIEGATASLLGRDFISNFNVFVNVPGIRSVTRQDVGRILKGEFPGVCSGTLGKFRAAKVSLQLKPGATPVHHRPRPVPWALREKVEAELERFESAGIIAPTLSSEWSSPIVPVVKDNGSVRVCGSFIALNGNLKDIYYPLPKIESIFAQLNGNAMFTKVDLKDAYLQFELDEQSKKLVTISTHKGLFTFNRLPYGIKNASFYCQKYIEQLFQGVDNVFVFQDDILIGHKSDENHMVIIRKVFEILKSAGLTVNIDKCRFLQDRISYLGFDLTADGLTKNHAKVQPVLSAPEPKDVTQLRSFIGMAMYYAKFVPAMSQILSPLFLLLRKDAKFEWSKECRDSFNKVKAEIASEKVLMYFDPDLPVVLTCDASEAGIAAVLSHKLKDGSERMVACVSRTYSKFEANYATVHKEALACYYGIFKFQEYLYGRKFTLQTDQKALVSIFGGKKDVNVMYANRIKRYVLFFSNFDFVIKHIKGENNYVADCLSRLPISRDILDDDDTEEPNNRIYFANTGVISNERVARETRNDKTLTSVKKYLIRGWPHKIPDDLKPFYTRKLELEVINECIFHGHRVVVPKSLQSAVLNEIHTTHEGIVRMKRIARSYIWFPGIDGKIEELCKACIHCLSNRSEPPKLQVAWPKADSPFHTVHIDHFTYRNREFLVVVDQYSKWLEVYPVKNITTETTVDKLRECFARFGLPVTVVSDNGPSLVSGDMEKFFTNNGIKHITIPPFNPQSNGLAECSVKTVKNKLKTVMHDPSNARVKVETLLARFLLTYNNTAHCTTNVPPSKLMFNRILRARIDLIKTPQTVTSTVTVKERLDPKRRFSVNDLVMVRDYRDVNKKAWAAARVVRKVGSAVYLCRLNSGQIWKRHPNQMIARGRGTSGVALGPVNGGVGGNAAGLDKRVSNLIKPLTCPARVVRTGGLSGGVNPDANPEESADMSVENTPHTNETNVPDVNVTNDLVSQYDETLSEYVNSDEDRESVVPVNSQSDDGEAHVIVERDEIVNRSDKMRHSQRPRRNIRRPKRYDCFDLE